jgi:hypothetical protein
LSVFVSTVKGLLFKFIGKGGISELLKYSCLALGNECMKIKNTFTGLIPPVG